MSAERPSASRSFRSSCSGGLLPGDGLARAQAVRGRPAWQAMTAWPGSAGSRSGWTALVNVGSLGIVLPLFPVPGPHVSVGADAASPGRSLFGLAGRHSGCGRRRVGRSSPGPYLSGAGARRCTTSAWRRRGFGDRGPALVAPAGVPLGGATGVRRVVNWRLPVMGLSGVTHRVPAGAGPSWRRSRCSPPVAASRLVRPSGRPCRFVPGGRPTRLPSGSWPSLQQLEAAARERAPAVTTRQSPETGWSGTIRAGLPCLLHRLQSASALLARRCLRAACYGWRGRPPRRHRLWAIGRCWSLAWSVIAVLWISGDPARPAVGPSRRLVPVVLPGLICLALWVCARGGGMRASEGRRAGPVAGSLRVSLLRARPWGCLPPVTTFDPGYTGSGNRQATWRYGGRWPSRRPTVARPGGRRRPCCSAHRVVGQRDHRGPHHRRHHSPRSCAAMCGMPDSPDGTGAFGLSPSSRRSSAVEADRTPGPCCLGASQKSSGAD